MVAVSLLATIAELSFKVGQLRSELENSSNEFKRVLDLFTVTSKTLDDLHSYSKNASLPPSQISNYTSHLKRHKDRFGGIEIRLRSIQQDLKSKTRLNRLLQPHGLDRRKLTDDIRAFNDDLNNIATRLINNVGHVGPASAVELSAGTVEINSQYVMEAMKIQEDERRRSIASSNPLGHTDIQSVGTDIYAGTMGWDFDLPLDFPLPTMGVLNRRTQPRSIIVAASRRHSSPDNYSFPQMRMGEGKAESSKKTETPQELARSLGHHLSIHQSTLQNKQGQESAVLVYYDDPWSPHQSTESLQKVIAIESSSSLNRHQGRYQKLFIQAEIAWDEQPKDDESIIRLFKEIDGRLTDHILNFYVAQGRETYEDEASAHIESSISGIKHLLLHQDSRIFSLRAIIANKIIRMASKEAELYISTPSTSLHKSRISRLARNIHSDTEKFTLDNSISSARLRSMEVVMGTAVNLAFTMANQPTRFEFSWPSPITGGPPDKVLLDPNTMEVVYRAPREGYSGDMRVRTVFPGLLKQKKRGGSPLAKAQVLLY